MKKLLIILLLLALIPSAWADTQASETLEPYYPAFDYDSAKADPDDYIGKWYTLNGMVNTYHEYEGVNEDGTHDSLIYLALDGDPDKQVIIMYQRPEEKPQPKYGDLVSCYGNFYKLYEQHLNIGGYITMPMFGTFYIVIL